MIEPFTTTELVKIRKASGPRSEFVQRLLATIDKLEAEVIRKSLPDDVMHDMVCERSLLTIMFQNALTDLCERLDAKDFFDPWHRWLFTELRLSWEAGEPMDCTAAMARWFSSGACRQRCRDAGLTESPGVIVVETFRMEYANLAHKEYLVRVLRLERVKRETASVLSKAAAWIAKNPTQTIEAITRLHTAVDGLWTLVAELLPEELGVTCDE